MFFTSIKISAKRCSKLSIVPLLLWLVSCGNSPSRISSEPVKSEINTRDSAPSTASEQFLAQAERESGTEQYQSLFRAAKNWQPTRCDKTLVITSRLVTVVSEQPLRSQVNLLHAECLWLTRTEHKSPDTDFAAILAQVQHFPHVLDRKLRLQSRVFEQQQNWWQAANTLASLTDASPEHVAKIWRLLGQLSYSELSQYREKASLLTPLVDLYLLLYQNAMDAQQLQVAVQRWQQQHPKHIYAKQPPFEVAKLLIVSAFEPQKMGVILPLSGRLAAQGSAVKEGILAAYYTQAEQRSVHADNRPMPELVFIDSQHSTPLTENTFSQLDFVVGPLLKQTIDVAEAFIQSPWLALNQTNKALSQPDQTALLPEIEEPATTNTQFFFALSPEGEGQQLARHLYQQGHDKPVVIQSDSAAAKRMTKAFLNTWYGLHEGLSNDVETVSFSDTKTMRASIQNLLNVASSRKRIKQIEAAIIPKVHAFDRSRRDIDAIVIFANNAETEIITPFIEANTSPFANILPVYATSRSHSSARSANSLRDLRNLQFMDMPWMLPGNPFKELKTRSAALWPKRQDNNKRLFAMGYDAFNLIRHLNAMQVIPKYEYKGLTGTLSLDADKNLRRILDWGQVKGEKIIRIGQPQT